MTRSRINVERENERSKEREKEREKERGGERRKITFLSEGSVKEYFRIPCRRQTEYRQESDADDRACLQT